MARIDVTELRALPEGYAYAVQVVEDDATYTYTVELPSEVYEEMVHGRVDRETLIQETFTFLLDRESAQEILPEFSLEDVGRYFPEFEGYIQKYLDIS